MGKLKSRKFIMAVVSGLLVVFNKGLDFNIPDNTIMAFAGIAISYIFGQGWVDGQEKKTEAVKADAAAKVEAVKAEAAAKVETVKAEAAAKVEAVKSEALKAVQAGAEFLSGADLKQGGFVLLRPLYVLLLLAMLSLCCLGVAQAGHPCKPTNPYHQMLESKRQWDNPGTRAQYLGDRAGYQDAQASHITARKRARAGK